MGIEACYLSGAPLLGSAFVYAIQESHLPGQIVCAILLLLSTLSWAVMVTKFVTVARARRHTARFLHTFRTSRAPLDIYSDSIRFENAPVYWVYRAGCKELSYQLTGSSNINEEFLTKIERGRKITPSQIESATNSMDRAVGEVGIRLENQMTFLATAVSGAPFLGLLGTVWGVMETFTGVASSSAATSLQDMSPGVSAALVTTVIALLVAIPAMFGYNFLISNIKTLLAEMDNFVAELTSAFERRYRDNIPTLDPALAAAAAAAGAPDTDIEPDTDLDPTPENDTAPDNSEPDDSEDAPPDAASPPPGYYSPPAGDPEPAPASEISPALEEVQDLNELPPPSSYSATAPGSDDEPEPDEDQPSPPTADDLKDDDDDDFITGLRSKPGENPLEDLLYGDDEDEDEAPAANQSAGSS